MAECLREPGLAPRQVRQRKNAILSDLRAEASNADKYVARVVNRVFFAGHPYAQRPDGTAESVEALNAAALRARLKLLLQSERMLIVLVGDHVYAGHGHNKGFPICVELESGTVAWGGDIRNAGTDSATVLYADGRLYFRYQNGVIILMDASPSGYKEQGTLEIPEVTRPSWAHLAISEGRLYVREQDNLYSYDLRDSSGKSAKIRSH